MDIESLRREYLPAKVELLLIGESPPKKGRFFYDTCTMTTFTSKPFEAVFNKSFVNNSEFLNFFKGQNCFLDDVCHYPIDHLDKDERENELSKSVPFLSKRLREWNPEVVCIVLKKIDCYVRSAVMQAGINPKIYTLPFPGNGHQNKYISELTNVLMEYRAK